MSQIRQTALSGPEHTHLDQASYTGCKTSIIDLCQLNLPEVASDEEYRRIYREYVKTKTSTSSMLERAINSITTGVAPPVAFPTETVYGLGADATNYAAVAGIFAAKGRPSDNPLIVHVSSVQHLERVLGGEDQIPAIYHELIKEFWPGPLTILLPLPTKHKLASNVHPGQTTVGFRVPLSKYARFFIAAANRPIAGPSANSSGKPSPTTASHVMDDMQGKINFILDGGNCDVGVESTVVDGTHDIPLILRPGGLSRSTLVEHGRCFNNAWARVQTGYEVHTSGEEAEVSPTNNGSVQNSVSVNGADVVHANSVKSGAPRAPGMKYKHYAPRARMLLLEPSFKGSTGPSKLAKTTELVRQLIQNCAASCVTTRSSLTLAILTSSSWPKFAGLSKLASPDHGSGSDNCHVSLVNPAGSVIQVSIHNISLGRSPTEIANRLFAALRTCDDLKCDLILAEAPSTARENDNKSSDEFETVLERMRKAASAIVNGQQDTGDMSELQPWRAN